MFRLPRAVHLIAAAAAVVAWAPAANAQRPDPLAPLVAEALKSNLGLAQERLAARRADAQVGEARALLLPTIGLESRGTRMHDVPNIGDLVNPAYAALNQLTGTNQFPTNIDI